MPFTRVFLRAGKPEAYRRAILDGLYRSMRDCFEVPEDDRFMVIAECDQSNFSYGSNYLDVLRSEDLVIVQITANNTRSTTQKKALYRRIVERLTENPGLRPEDIFINLVEVKPENWSFGLGLAQYAPD